MASNPQGVNLQDAGQLQAYATTEQRGVERRSGLESFANFASEAIKVLPKLGGKNVSYENAFTRNMVELNQARDSGNISATDARNRARQLMTTYMSQGAAGPELTKIYKDYFGEASQIVMNKGGEEEQILRDFTKDINDKFGTVYNPENPEDAQSLQIFQKAYEASNFNLRNMSDEMKQYEYMIAKAQLGGKLGQAAEDERALVVKQTVREMSKNASDMANKSAVAANQAFKDLLNEFGGDFGNVPQDRWALLVTQLRTEYKDMQANINSISGELASDMDIDTLLLPFNNIVSFIENAPNLSAEDSKAWVAALQAKTELALMASSESNYALLKAIYTAFPGAEFLTGEFTKHIGEVYNAFKAGVNGVAPAGDQEKFDTLSVTINLLREDANKPESEKMPKEARKVLTDAAKTLALNPPKTQRDIVALAHMARSGEDLADFYLDPDFESNRAAMQAGLEQFTRSVFLPQVSSKLEELSTVKSYVLSGNLEGLMDLLVPSFDNGKFSLDYSDGLEEAIKANTPENFKSDYVIRAAFRDALIQANKLVSPAINDFIYASSLVDGNIDVDKQYDLVAKNLLTGLGISVPKSNEASTSSVEASGDVSSSSEGNGSGVGSEAPVEPVKGLSVDMEKVEGDSTLPKNINQYDPLFEASAKKYNVSALLLKAIGIVESSLDSSAKSGAQAGGVMQLMPKTATGLGVEDVHDPAQNIEGGAKHLAWLFGRFSDLEGEEQLTAVLSSYNIGDTRIRKNFRETGKWYVGETSEEKGLLNGKPQKGDENAEYARKVKEVLKKLKKLV